MKKKLYILMSALIIGALSCGEKQTNFAALDQFSKNQQVEWLKKLSSIIISDIFSPPVCSRIYAYTNIAAYEALRPAHPQQFSYGNKLNGLGSIPLPDTGKTAYFPISSIMAFITVGKKLVFNADTFASMEKQFLKELDQLPIHDSLKAYSIAYGQQVGQFILAWAAKDQYLQRNSYPAYLVTKDITRWQPTPPDYMDAVETNWRTLRSFTLDTVSQFRPAAPLKFDTLKNTPFYKEVSEVFETGNHLTEEQIAIAQFWDCNPNTSVTQGHVTYFQQKLSPPGHWIHLTATLTQKEGFDAIKTAETLSKTAISMADGFISCWEAKYFYNYTRPETFINRYVDKEWKPLIQTPPFPEYPSGHSVCSGSASVILSHYFGENYAYIDNTEAPFGMPARSFKSLSDAATEASMSRLYGGIHFKNALTVGLEQGKKVGNHVLYKLNSGQDKKNLVLPLF